MILADLAALCEKAGDRHPSMWSASEWHLWAENFPPARVLALVRVAEAGKALSWALEGIWAFNTGAISDGTHPLHVALPDFRAALAALGEPGGDTA